MELLPYHPGHLLNVNAPRGKNTYPDQEKGLTVGTKNDELVQK